MNRIGISCPPLTLRPFREAASQILPRFEHWEIISDADHFLPDIRNEVRELLETTNMTLSIHAPYSDINLAALDRGTREHTIRILLDIVNIAADLGIGPVTLHPGSVRAIQHWDRGRVPRLTRESLEKLALLAHDNSVLLALENMPNMRSSICTAAGEMGTMLDGLDIGMCFDIGHANTTGQIEEMMALAPRFTNVHVHDNNGDKDSHMPLGQGNIDFGVLKRLTDYRGHFVIEAKSTDLDEAVASREYLAGILS